MMINKTSFVDFLYERFPNARCALNFSTPFQCIVAVALSAQTTDKSVNNVTPVLFEKYPDAKTMAKAEVSDIECIIKKLGMYKNKAKNLSLMSRYIMDSWNGEIHLDFDELQKLPGVGIKTANVVLAECSNRPAIAVDTHVARIAKRLGFAGDFDSPEEIEKKLEKEFPKEIWVALHHKIIFFGREICHAKNPQCSECVFTNVCKHYKKCSSRTSR